MSVHRLAEVLELSSEDREDRMAQIEAEAKAGKLGVTGLRKTANGWVREILDWSSYVFDWAGEKPPSGYMNAPCARRGRLHSGRISFEAWRAKGESRLEEQLRLARAQELPNAPRPAPGTLTEGPTRAAVDRVAIEPPPVASLPEDEPEFEPGDIYFDLAVTEKAWKRLSKVAETHARTVARISDNRVKEWLSGHHETLRGIGGKWPPTEDDDMAAAKAQFGDRVTSRQIRAARRELLGPLRPGRRPKPSL
jgi:hypothetical protein